MTAFLQSPFRAQALFLHDRMILNALDGSGAEWLTQKLQSNFQADNHLNELSRINALEQAAAALLSNAVELDVAVAGTGLVEGDLVALTQDFYIRRASEKQGAFRVGLDIDREVKLRGTFSNDRLIGSTGQIETFGHKRFTMLAYVGDFELSGRSKHIELRPLFIGWRVADERELQLSLGSDRQEIFPAQIDQFALIQEYAATKSDVTSMKSMSEEQIKSAFAAIIGEPYVPADWGGENSDLITGRLTMNGQPLAAAFAFKGPAQKGKLYISSMGSRGDQGLRLLNEPADLIVVQHHSEITAAVRNLMSALARQSGRKFMVVDGEATAQILAAYDMLGRKTDADES